MKQIISSCPSIVEIVHIDTLKRNYDKFYVAKSGFSGKGIIIAADNRDSFELHCITSGFTSGNKWSYLCSKTFVEMIKTLLNESWQVFECDTLQEVADALK